MRMVKQILKSGADKNEQPAEQGWQRLGKYFSAGQALFMTGSRNISAYWIKFAFIRN